MSTLDATSRFGARASRTLRRPPAAKTLAVLNEIARIATRSPSQLTHPSAMVAAADRALYRAKQEGRNPVLADAPPARPPG